MKSARDVQSSLRTSRRGVPGSRTTRGRSLTPWLGAAALLHLVLWATWRERAEPKRGVNVVQQPELDAVEFDVVALERESVAPMSPARNDSAPNDHAPNRHAPNDHAPNDHMQVHDVVPTDLPSTKLVASREAVARPTQTTRQTSEPAVGSPARPVPEVSETRAANESTLGVGEHTASGEGAESGVVAMGAARRTPLPRAEAHVQLPVDRLAALGYGTPNKDVLRPLLDVAPSVVAEERLNQHLVQAIVETDRDRSMGIEGPVTNALHTAAMSVVVPTSLSKVVMAFGRDGKLADFRIMETNRGAGALKALEQRVKHLLANQTVRVPSGRAMEFVYEVKSEVLLPSGRAPGLAVEVLGIPLKAGRSEKSSKISILTPHLEFKSQSEPDPERNGKIAQTPPQLVWGMSVLGISADAVDIGAPERQVVHTRLIRQRVL